MYRSGIIPTCTGQKGQHMSTWWSLPAGCCWDIINFEVCPLNKKIQNSSKIRLCILLCIWDLYHFGLPALVKPCRFWNCSLLTPSRQCPRQTDRVFSTGPTVDVTGHVISTCKCCEGKRETANGCSFSFSVLDKELHRTGKLLNIRSSNPSNSLKNRVVFEKTSLL